MAIDPGTRTGAPAALAAFACADGSMLFVPAVCEPPREAERTHGPLLFRGHIDIDPAAFPAWEPLLAQIDRHLFACVGMAEVALLLGPAAAALCVLPAGRLGPG